MIEISTPDAPQPAGHYTQAIVHGDLVYVSGIEEQTDQAIRNLAGILNAANSGLNQVVKTTVYISDIELWGRVNAVYSRLFGEHRPARAVVPTRELHFGCQIEIDAIAAVRR